MTVEIHDTVGDAPLAAEELARIARAALVHGEAPDLGLSVVLVGDAALTEMHGRFLDDPTPTDVITFDLRDEGVGGAGADAASTAGPDGELYVSLDCARRVAAERGRRVEDELALYVVHGALHLCGYDDHEERERDRMRSAERAVLERLGYTPDPEFHRP